MKADEDYKFAELPLTAHIAKELIVKAFAGQVANRQTITKTIVQIHKERGGEDAKAVDVDRSVVKRALERLRADGKAENASQGYWRIESMLDSLGSEVSKGSKSPNTPDEEEIIEPNSPFENCVGDGEGAVYLYYLPSYKLLAESQGESLWPCKIGWTDHDPLLRVKSQAATSTPEKPEIALLIKTDKSSEMETAIHAILALRSKRLENAPGTEWFLTCPSEVEEIHDFIQEHSAED